MAKAAIRKLKSRRFWRWLCVEVYGKPEPKQPIKQRPAPRLKRKNFERAWARVRLMLERRRGGDEVVAR